MCGICGVFARNLMSTELTGFQQLLILNQFRGMDSTGVIGITEGKKGYVSNYVKDIYDPTYFMTTPSKEKNKLFDHKDKVAYIGHCRSATIGSVKADNAHPFDFPKLIGVHNGTMQGDLPNDDKYGTDSEALFKHINDVGVDAAFAEMNWGSAYSLVWFDKENQTINFLRNDKRPLWFTFAYSQSTIFWSSEKRALQFIASPESRQSFGVAGELWQYKPDHLVTLDINTSLPKNIHGRDIKTKQVYGNKKPVTGTVWPYGGYHEGGIPWDEDLEGDAPVQDNTKETTLPFNDSLPPMNSTTGSRVTSVPSTGLSASGSIATNGPDRALPSHHSHPTTPEQKLVTKAKHSKLLDHKFKGCRGVELTYNQFGTKMLEGCCLCGAIEDPDEVDIEYKVAWAATDRFVCQDCMTQPWVQKFMVEYQATKGK